MKISDKYLFSPPDDLRNIKKILASKKLSGTNDIISKYEKKLSSFFNSHYAVAVSSGTAAIQTALFAIGVKQKDEVIVSSTPPLMTVFPMVYIGARPIFCDTKRGNFGVDPACLGREINSKTRAIVETPMWGYPTEVDKLYEFAKKKKVPLILDLAQAQGTKLNGKYLSFYGDISCFSTHDRKLIATGEGGYILTNNRTLYDRAKKFIKFGDMNGFDFGLNYKLGALQAAVGINRIEKIGKQIEKRRKNAKYIVKKLENPNIKEIKIIDDGLPNYYSLLLVLRFNDNPKILRILETKGIPSDIIRYNYKVLYKYPVFKKFRKHCNNSERLVEKITTIPVHPNLGKSDLDYMIKILNNLRSG